MVGLYIGFDLASRVASTIGRTRTVGIILIRKPETLKLISWDCSELSHEFRPHPRWEQQSFG